VVVLLLRLLFPFSCIDISVCARADSKVIDGKRNDAEVIPNIKKITNDMVRSAEIRFMNHWGKNMF
jgi:hypothetical protein